MKNSYIDMKKKMEETIGDYDDLVELKRATYNHFLSKWESENEKNQASAGGTPLRVKQPSCSSRAWSVGRYPGVGCGLRAPQCRCWPLVGSPGPLPLKASNPWPALRTAQRQGSLSAAAAPAAVAPRL